ncbi:MAG: hypothetical protein D6782_10540, partial [Alphaproteobacteria bacterium]
MHILSAFGAAVVGACLLAANASAAGVSLRLSSGIDFSKGDYGSATDTEILTVPLRAALSVGDFEFSLASSYLDVTGSGNVIPGGAGPIVTQRCEQLRRARPDLFDRFCRDRLSRDPVEERFSNSGIGDTILGALWSLPQATTGEWLVDLGARVKLPTASEAKSLGTGKADYSFSLDISRGFGPWTVYAGGGYRILGDPEIENGTTGAAERIELKNGATANAGVIYSFASGMNVSLGYDYLARSITAATATREAVLGLSLPLGDGGWRWSGYGVAGLSRSSVGFAGGFALFCCFGGLWVS